MSTLAMNKRVLKHKSQVLESRLSTLVSRSEYLPLIMSVDVYEQMDGILAFHYKHFPEIVPDLKLYLMGATPRRYDEVRRLATWYHGPAALCLAVIRGAYREVVEVLDECGALSETVASITAAKAAIRKGATCPGPTLSGTTRKYSNSALSRVIADIDPDELY